MDFNFSTATRIVFGRAKVREVAAAVPGMGERAMLVTNRIKEADYTNLDAIRERGFDIEKELNSKGVETFRYLVSGEPSIEMVEEGILFAKEKGMNVFVGIGGGSAIDTAKAISAVMANGGECLDYLEVIGKGKKITKKSLPFVAVPTTAGTGAEVSANAVLASMEHNVKVSLRSPLMIADLAIVDPELTISVPPAVTASTGLDAFTQVIEPFVSRMANPITDALCREGMKRASRSLYKAYLDGEDIEAREDLCIVSLFGGICLANAKLGAVHGFAGPLGGLYHGAHGAICAALLPHVVEVNVAALRERDAESPILERYREVARIVTTDQNASVEDGVRWIAELVKSMQIKGLAEYGMKEEDFPRIITMSSASSSMKGNCIELNEKEMREILSRAL
ncbi:MAG TPA: iron-containing alcohol dehydrogenase [Anaerolineaceae bacterium]|nr:iron-containing alcohol dehydrogenase [Anaerolineaceae bacterium]